MEKKRKILLKTWGINIINCLLVIFFITGIIFLLIVFFSIDPNQSEINFCIGQGYCWDYNRNRCEEKDQGYCIKNQKRCDEVEGIWNEKEKYCKLPF